MHRDRLVDGLADVRVNQQALSTVGHPVATPGLRPEIGVDLIEVSAAQRGLASPAGRDDPGGHGWRCFLSMNSVVLRLQRRVVSLTLIWSIIVPGTAGVTFWGEEETAMALESDLAVFSVGVAGGAANELLHWWGLRENPNLPEYAKRGFYWIVTLGMVALGGALAWLQLGSQADALIAFQIGLAAPMLLQKLMKAAPGQTGGMGAPRPSVRDFLRG